MRELRELRELRGRGRQKKTVVCRGRICFFFFVVRFSCGFALLVESGDKLERRKGLAVHRHLCIWGVCGYRWRGWGWGVLFLHSFFFFTNPHTVLCST